MMAVGGNTGILRAAYHAVHVHRSVLANDKQLAQAVKMVNDIALPVIIHVKLQIPRMGDYGVFSPTESVFLSFGFDDSSVVGFNCQDKDVIGIRIDPCADGHRAGFFLDIH